MEHRTLVTNSELRASQGDEFSLVGYAARFDSLSRDLGGFKEKLMHPTPCCFDHKGYPGSRRSSNFGRTFAEWVHMNAQNQHIMTEKQRIAYNVRQLGQASAAIFEENHGSNPLTLVG